MVIDLRFRLVRSLYITVDGQSTRNTSVRILMALKEFQKAD